MQELEFLQQKVNSLLKRFTALQADNERMRKTIVQLEQRSTEQAAKILELEQELQLKSVINSASGLEGEEREKLKKHLDNVINEIEKNLGML